MSEITLTGPSGYLTVQFLDWLAAAPRTYGEVMEAWRTSCPRLSIWEDAVIDDLVGLGEGSGRQRRVVLTERGRLLLQDAAASHMDEPAPPRIHAHDASPSGRSRSHEDESAAAGTTGSSP